MRRVFLLAALALLPSRLFAQDRSDALWIHFLDVGQGDATLIEAPSGQRVLIDAGPSRGIVDQLRELEVEDIDLFIASHNHADHIGGAAAVIREFPIRFFMDNGVPHTTVTYRTMLEALAARDVPLLEPERRTIEFGDAAIDIVPPPGDPSLGHNDNSIGVVLRFGAFRAMFAGDAEAHLWRHGLATSPEAIPDVHVHKASHHGSRNGDIGDAIARLRPQLVVISAGAGNQFGHPHEEALALYETVGADILITAEHGTVTVAAAANGSFEVLEPSTRDARQPDTPVDPTCVDLNRADLTDLQRIIHVGFDRAEQIIRLRGQRAFESIREITRVDGIGSGRLREIESQGVACVM
jgi:competence protein ComEC